MAKELVPKRFIIDMIRVHGGECPTAYQKALAMQGFEFEDGQLKEIEKLDIFGDEFVQQVRSAMCNARESACVTEDDVIEWSRILATVVMGKIEKGINISEMALDKKRKYSLSDSATEFYIYGLSDMYNKITGK